MDSQVAFRMQLKAGCADEYERRHDQIWPELRQLLIDSGIRDYSIYADEPTSALFGVMRRDHYFDPEALAQQPVMRRWWDYMADLMEVRSDHRPLEWPLRRVFRL